MIKDIRSYHTLVQQTQCIYVMFISFVVYQNRATNFVNVGLKHLLSSTCESAAQATGQWTATFPRSALARQRAAASWQSHLQEQGSERRGDLTRASVKTLHTHRMLRDGVDAQPCAFLRLANGAWTLLRLDRKNCVQKHNMIYALLKHP